MTHPNPGDAELIEVEVGPVAHGGHCVARHEGRVVFVRHTLPGERVRVRLTQAGPQDKFWRGDAVEILDASADRVASVWPEAGPGGVGGGELAHIRLGVQREWKHAVVREQFVRLAQRDPEFVVEPAPGDDARDGLGWRTRISLVADAQGRPGMRMHRSHEIVPLTDMPLATEQVLTTAREAGVFTRSWEPGTVLDVVAPAGGAEPLVLADGVPWRSGRLDRRPNARRTVVESITVDGKRYDFRIPGDGFWQVHREAPEVLATAVLDAARVAPGERVLELFSGAGLLTAPLADAVGDSGSVIAVEGDARAVRSARRALHAAPHVELHAGDVARTLAELPPRTAVDVVVLDPPRVGAGRRVMQQIARLEPERIVYVACDPAALARDVAYAAESEPRYELTTLRAFDLFPHTHHVECLAVLTRIDGSGY